MKPLICIPMGDPAGIGAEIIIKSLHQNNFSDTCRIAVIADQEYMERAADCCNIKVQFVPFSSGVQCPPSSIPLIHTPITAGSSIHYGQVSTEAGQAAMLFIEKSVELVNSLNAQAIVTPPINKKSLRAAHIPFIGHTEILASLTHTPSPMTLFQVHNLRVCFLTRHLSLRDACSAITQESVLEGIHQSINALESLGAHQPHLAVAGLNPHCGEGGQFGDEELLAIQPAVKKARYQGLHVSGPYPADSVFYQALQGQFDAVLSLYHDQGHIATKMVDFERTVSITCGLPFLRTSVDHGTAYDIAGTGQASEVSMTEAIRVAALYTDTPPSDTAMNHSHV